MSDVFDLRARVSADATPFNKAMESSATSVSSALSSINSAANMFIGNGAVRAFSRATNAAYEFGQVMADISSISDVGIRQLSRNIKQLDNVYGSMSSVGNSIYNIISSGFDRSNAELIEIVKNVGQASKSIRANLYSTANVFTTVANAYNLSADQFKNIADLLFVTVKEGKAEGHELARTLGLVVNTASEAGLSFAEMSAVISTLSRTQTTSQAMIGFNQMLNAMIKPSREAAETAKQFGIEFGAAALRSKGFTAIIKDMHDKLQGNVEAINKISGPIRAMRAVVSLTGKQYENFINILEKAEAQIGTGVAVEAFAKQTDTAKQALENLKVQLDKTFIGVGQDLEPITKWITEFAEDFLKAFSNSDGIGKWSIYVTALLGAFKGIYKTYTTIKTASDALSINTSNTTDKAKTYADHMERAKNATKDVALATSNISKNLTNSIVKFNSGKALGSEVLYQSKGYTPNTITDSQRANVLRTPQERLANARASVALAKEAHTPNIKSFYEAKNSLQRATSGRDIAQSNFFDAMELRKEAQRLLKDKQWSTQNLVAQLPAFQRNSSYGKELQATLDAQLRRAQADVSHMMKVETGAREIYYKSEKSLADAEGRFQQASKAYTISVSKLKQAQAELQSMVKAERAIIANTESSEGNAKASARPTKDLTMTATQKANARKLKATRRAAMSFERQDALIARYNKRFKKNYEYLGERTNRTGIDWKRSFAEILGRGGVLSKLYNGFSAVTSALAACETGLAIGTSLRKRFNLDDAFTSASTKRMERENDATNIDIIRKTTFRYLKTLETQKKVNDAELARLSATIALADSTTELYKVQRGIIKRMRDGQKDNVPDGQTRYEDALRDAREKRENALNKANNRTYATAEQIAAASEIIDDMQLSRWRIRSLFKAGKLTDMHKRSGGGTDWLDVAANFVNWEGPLETEATSRAREWDSKIANAPNLVRTMLRKQLIEAFKSDNPLALDAVASEFKATYGKYIAGLDKDRAREANTDLNELTEELSVAINLLKALREKGSTASEQQSRRNAEVRQINTNYAQSVLNAVNLMDTERDSQYAHETSAYYRQRGSRMDSQRGAVDDAIAILSGSSSTYTKQADSLTAMRTERDRQISRLRAEGIDDAQIQEASASSDEFMATKYDAVQKARDAVLNADRALHEAISARVDAIDKELRKQGFAPDTAAFASEMHSRLRYEIKSIDRAIARATDDRVRGSLIAARSIIAGDIQGQRDAYFDNRSNLRNRRIEAGIITESQGLRESISDLQYRRRKEVADIQELQQRRYHINPKSSAYGAYTKLIADAQKRLADTSIELRSSFTKLADKSNEVRTGLMNTIQGFTQQRTSNGKMTNDALWHSVNLASRMGGMVRSQPYMIKTSMPINRRQSDNLRRQAQGAVSARVDAWIMSQKYAEANVGKTVTDIFTFMKQNNTIVVRNK